MKLEAFVAGALQSGHSRYRLASSGRGHELGRGELAGVTAALLEDLCKEDAMPLVRDTLHEYVLTVESEDGAKFSRFTVRVHGGAGSKEDEHRVDPLQTTTPAAVVGHLVRLVVDQQKQFTALASKLLERDIAEDHELMKLRRAQARRGEHEITAKVIEMEAADRAAERERNADLWKRALTLGGPLLARILPGGADTALASLRSSFSDAQLEQLCALLGPARFGKLLSLETPEKVAALFIDEIPPALGQQVFALLTDAQKTMVGAALKAEMDRREKSAKASTPATSNGAPS